MVQSENLGSACLVEILVCALNWMAELGTANVKLELGLAPGLEDQNLDYCTHRISLLVS